MNKINSNDQFFYLKETTNFLKNTPFSDQKNSFSYSSSISLNSLSYLYLSPIFFFNIILRNNIFFERVNLIFQYDLNGEKILVGGHTMTASSL